MIIPKRMKTKENHQRLTGHASAFTLATLISRMLGYGRDTAVAAFFGAGNVADAFYAAFRISNLLRRLLGEGALAASFIPVFTEISEKKGREETRHFLHVLFSFLLILLVAVTAAGILFAPYLSRGVAWGFGETPQKLELTTSLTRQMFPFILFISLAALATGVLNTQRVFFLPAVAPAALSVSEIVYVLAVAPLLAPENQVKGLAWSVTLGGALQLAVQLPSLVKRGFSFLWRWTPQHPGLRHVGRLMLPVTIGLSVDQLNAFVDTIFASFLQPGSVTALYYSNRVMQLPLALFGIAMASVALPSMSASAAREDIAEVKDTLNFSLRLVLFTIVPATLGLLTLSKPIVQALFQHGRFGLEGVEMTSDALFYYSLGLFSYSAVKILASAFYALQDTRTPVAVAAGAVILNAILNLALMRRMGVGGLALATSIASTLNAGTLYALLRRRIGRLATARVLTTLAQSVTASIPMVFSTVFAIAFLEDHRYVGLACAILIGVLVYAGFARLIKMEEWQPLWATLKRSSPTPDVT